MVLVMTVNPGASGQKFIMNTLPKINQLRELIQSSHSNAMIEVDGGITVDTLPLALREGARIFVAASAIFHYAGGIASGVQSLRGAAVL
jgi:ribulose-phosphate 3-epimerase